MAIEGMIATQDGETTNIIGLTGTDLECEGCEEKTTELYETEDSVMLCKPCYDAIAEDEKVES